MWKITVVKIYSPLTVVLSFNFNDAVEDDKAALTVV